MEMLAFNSEAVAMQKPIVSILVKAMVVDTVLAAQKAILCFLMMAEVLLKNEDGLLDLIGGDQRFPVDELHRRKCPEPENVDGSDTEDDDEDDDDAEQDEDDDDGDEDFSGEEGGEDDEEGDPEEDPVANGNGGSDDEDDGDDDDGDEDGDGDDDEDEEDEDDEDEEDAPPAKKRK